nr:DNA replication and repair protein RecF [Candidatus Gracilibacteria bacterium]
MFTELEFQNFRNLKNASWSTSSVGAVFLGLNGQGKSNLLEALYVLASGHSYRTKKLSVAINFAEQSFHLKAKDLANNYYQVSAASWPSNRSEHRFNHRVVSLSSYAMHLPVSIFTAQDWEFFFGSPASKRDYWDNLLSQLNNTYYTTLSRYEGVLKQRNRLLKQIREGLARKSELTAWDQELIPLGDLLWQMRQELAENWRLKISNYYQKLSQNTDLVDLAYKPKRDTLNWGEDLLKRQNKDILLASTTVGPHRDEWEWLIRGRSAREFASQGEQRSLILAAKLLEIQELESQFGKPAILLLDDVFSELDENRQLALAELCRGRQTFLS